MANNGAVASPVFQPAMRMITNITNANPCVITTSFAHNFYSTDIVMLYIPRAFGLHELSNRIGQVTVIDDTSFSFPVDTTLMDAYSDPSNTQYAQVVPFAEASNTVVGAVRNTLPTRNR